MKASAYNVAALEKLLGLCNKHSASYKPGNPSIERTALTTLLEEAQKSIDAVQKAEGDLTKAVNLRHREFDTLPLVVTRIISLAEAGGMPPDHLADVNAIRKKFRSQPQKGTARNEGPGGQAGQNAHDVSVPSAETLVKKKRELNFISKATNFAELTKFLESESTYAPTEPEFTIEGLKEKLETLRNLTKTVEEAKSALNGARHLRNELFGNKNTGVCATGRKVKKYLRGVFGTRSERFNEISKIKFLNK